MSILRAEEWLRVVGYETASSVYGSKRDRMRVELRVHHHIIVLRLAFGKLTITPFLCQCNLPFLNARQKQRPTTFDLLHFHGDNRFGNADLDVKRTLNRLRLVPARWLRVGLSRSWEI